MQRVLFSWLLVACGCGSVKSNPMTGVDAGVDAAGPSDAAVTGMVDVVTQTRFFVSGGGAPGTALSGVDVVSVPPDGDDTADMAQSDASGHARLKVHVGGSLTAIYHHPADTGTDLVTYFGVKPGDVLTFGQHFPRGGSGSLGSMTFSYPPVNNVNLYQVYGPCGNAPANVGTLSVTLTELASCHRDPMDIVFVALDSSSRVLGYNYLSVAFHVGTSASIATWELPKTALVNITGLSADVQNLNAFLANVGNVDQRMYSFFVNGQATGGAYSNSFPWAATAVRTEARLVMARPGTFQPIQLLDVLRPDSTSWTVASPALPPWLQSSTASTANRTASFTLVGDGPYDAAVVQVAWQHMVGSTPVPSAWTFILPPGMTSFTFPTLPAQFAGVLPDPNDDFSTEAHIIEIPSVQGYDALRAIPESSLICPASLVPDCSLRDAEFQRIIFD